MINRKTCPVNEKPAEQRIIKACDLMEPALVISPALCNKKMKMRMKIYHASKRLYHSNNAWCDLFACASLEVFHKRLSAAETKRREKRAFILEEYPQHLGYGKDNLAVRCIQDKLLPHPLTPFLTTLGMTRGAESAGLAGKHQ